MKFELCEKCRYKNFSCAECGNCINGNSFEQNFSFISTVEAIEKFRFKTPDEVVKKGIEKWAILKNKISKMERDEFIDFASNHFTCECLRDILNLRTDKCGGYQNCFMCKKECLEEEYDIYTIDDENKLNILKKENNMEKTCNNLYDEFVWIGNTKFTIEAHKEIVENIVEYIKRHFREEATEEIETLYAALIDMKDTIASLNRAYEKVGDCLSSLRPKTKEKNYIVHRTLRTRFIGEKNKEIYISGASLSWGGYEKEKARKFTEKEAIKLRDELNTKRVGKRYLWVISKIDKE